MSNHPSKEVVRNWLHQRRTQVAPPPSIEQVRRELGWKSAGGANPFATTPPGAK